MHVILQPKGMKRLSFRICIAKTASDKEVFKPPRALNTDSRRRVGTTTHFVVSSEKLIYYYKYLKTVADTRQPFWNQCDRGRTDGDLCMNTVVYTVAGHEVCVHFVEGLKVTDSCKWLLIEITDIHNRESGFSALAKSIRWRLLSSSVQHCVPLYWSHRWPWMM